jgi:hypothetical protein
MTAVVAARLAMGVPTPGRHCEHGLIAAVRAVAVGEGAEPEAEMADEHQQQEQRAGQAEPIP